MILRFAALALAISMTGAAPAGRNAERISLDVRNIDIYDAVRLLADQAGINVVVDASVEHRAVTIRLIHVTFARALASLARSNDLETATVDNVIYLGAADAINRRYPAGPSGATSATFTLRNGDAVEIAKTVADTLPHGTLVVADRRTSSIAISGNAVALDRARALLAGFDATVGAHQTVVALRYVKAAEAVRAVVTSLGVAPPESAIAGDQQNAVILSGPEAFVTRATALVEGLDRPGKQVRYDVRVTDVSPSETGNVGFLWRGANADLGTATSAFVGNSFPIDVTLDALVQKNEAKILARPTISSLNNVPASLLVGEQYPIVYFDARTGTQQVQFVNVGVNLNVTPTIGADGAITTDLETDYSQVVGTSGGFPIIATRKAQSTLRVSDDQTIVIAGLFSDVDQSTLSKVPFLGDIPIVGEIFRNRATSHRKDEVVFLITPHIVPDDPAASPTPASSHAP